MIEITRELKQNGIPSPENPVEIENEIYVIKDGKKIKLERTDMIRLFEQELKVATEKEKTADKLFEESGYEKSQVVGNAQQCYFANAKGKSIAFNLNKTVSIFGNYNWFTMQELKAINKKVEELKWKQ